MERTAQPDRLLDPPALADFLGVPVGTIYQWSHRGTGPTAYRVGRHLRYRMGDVEAWLTTQAVARP